MTTYGGGRYRLLEQVRESSSICLDTNLDRRVSIHWITPLSLLDAVRARIAALQDVRSPYVALIYDLVIDGKRRMGIVEEELSDPVTVSGEDRLRRIYELCAGISALHEHNLAHGALDEHSFRVGPLGRGRLCNLTFQGDHLDEPSIDNKPLAVRLRAMGADDVGDAAFQVLRSELTRKSSSSSSTVRRLGTRLAALMLRDQHRALLHWRGTSVELSAARRSARFAHPMSGVAAVSIRYDGTRFSLNEVAGEVRINNRSLSEGEELPHSCVIALGDSHRPRSQRYFITFDQSHPEVA